MWHRGSSARERSETQKCYEQTQHLIENKEYEFWGPSMLLKISQLLMITQHVVDK
jgi:hypothetical protein